MASIILENLIPIPVRSVGLETNLSLGVSTMLGVELLVMASITPIKRLSDPATLKKSTTSAARSLVESVMAYSPVTGFVRAYASWSA